MTNKNFIFYALFSFVFFFFWFGVGFVSGDKNSTSFMCSRIYSLQVSIGIWYFEFAVFDFNAVATWKIYRLDSSGSYNYNSKFKRICLFESVLSPLLRFYFHLKMISDKRANKRRVRMNTAFTGTIFHQ